MSKPNLTGVPAGAAGFVVQSAGGFGLYNFFWTATDDKGQILEPINSHPAGNQGFFLRCSAVKAARAAIGPDAKEFPA